MISEEAFPVEPWQIRETRLNLNLLAQSESVFALSNGHIGLRGNLDEGEPYGLPGTYLNSFYEIRPLPYAEAGYGYPEAGQTVVDVTNGKIIRLMVDDEPFDVRYGELLDHERILDLRAGTLTRCAHWRSPTGKQVKVTSTRLVSLVHRSVAAIEYVVEAIDDFSRVTVQSELVTNEDQPVTSDDPRVAAILDNPLEAVDHEITEGRALLMHRTRSSALMMAAAMDHEVEVPGRYEINTDARADLARTTVICGLRPGQKLRIVKYLAYGWSSLRSRPGLRDQAAAALSSARYSGWQGLLDGQRAYLDLFWDAADVEVEGDPESQQAVRFGHVPPAAVQRARRTPGHPQQGPHRNRLRRPRLLGHRGFRAAGAHLHGAACGRRRAALAGLDAGPGQGARRRTRPGRRRLPVAHHPRAGVLGLLACRHRGLAHQRRHRDGLRALPHRHGDDSLEEECGLPVLIETARLWMSLGHHDRHGVWHLDGVTGPDEYTAIVRDNVFTNLMAANNLRIAAEAAMRHPDKAGALGVTTEEMAAWRDAADAAHIPYDEELGVHQQCEGFTTFAEWNFEANTTYPLLMHEAYVRLYPAQVIKQADLVLAMQWQSHEFTPEQKARNVDYYERRTVRDSSLSACTQAVMCAEVGHLELAHDYAYEAALIDLRDLHRNTRDGLHMASLAGAWTALVAGFGGLRDDEGILSIDPQLPDGISRLRFRLRWRGFRRHRRRRPRERHLHVARRPRTVS